MIKKVKSLLTSTNFLQRSALTALAIKIGAAGLGFVTQILLANLLGQQQYGDYSYFWVWISVGTVAVSMGLSEAAVRFIAEYRETHQYGLGWGFIASSLTTVSALSAGVGLVGIGATFAFQDLVPEGYFWLICLAFACLPVFALQDLITGFALAFSWTGLAHIPPYIIRQLLIIIFVVAFVASAQPATATLAIFSALLAGIIALLGQSILFFRAARRRLPRSAKETKFVYWVKTSIPMFMGDGFQMLLSFADIIILGLFVKSDMIALYYAATRISTQVGTVQFAVASAVAQRMSGLKATEKIEELHDLIAGTTRWIFWPTFAVFGGVVAMGWPLLWLFGSEFTEAYPILLILAFGALALASVGGAEDALKMVGHERVEFAAKASSTILNLVLNLSLIPFWGIYGAAIATASSLCIQALLSELMVRKYIGTSTFIMTLKG